MAFHNINEPIAKGAVTRALDEISVRDDARARLDALRTVLRGLPRTGFRGFEAVLEEHLLKPVFPAAQVPGITAYLKQYWFDPETAWWPAFQPIAPVYALGLLQALNESLGATGRPLPFDAYWLMGHHVVELITLVSPRQVTLLIATPAPPEAAPSGIAGESSTAWVTTRRAGTTPNEIDPITGQSFAGDASLRERTYKVQPRPRGKDTEETTMRPFEGVKILDCTHVLAGPFAAYQLAVLGADVIKVEDPNEPDQSRESGADMALNKAMHGHGLSHAGLEQALDRART